jgi:hypothetical protein
VNARRLEQTAVALRVLADCTKRGLVAANPSGVLVYGRQLSPIELRWLVEGLEAATVDDLAVTVDGQMEDKEISGFVYGQWLLRIAIPKRRAAELHDILRRPARAR